MIWRIKIHEIALFRRYFLEVLFHNPRITQRDMTGAQHVFLADSRFCCAPHRHVELAFGIHAPQAVVASLVEVDEAGGYLDAIFEKMLAADLVIVVGAVIFGVLVQLLYEGIGVALDDFVGVNQVRVNVT